jgi:hypothetical protein
VSLAKILSGHLKRLLSAYVRYYHEDRTHLGLGKRTIELSDPDCVFLKWQLEVHPYIHARHTQGLLQPEVLASVEHSSSIAGSYSTFAIHGPRFEARMKLWRGIGPYFLTSR